MFAAFGFGQAYFGQGPMIVIVPVDGPIHVEGLEDCHPQALHVTGKKARTTGLRAKKPMVTNTEQCP